MDKLQGEIAGSGEVINSFDRQVTQLHIARLRRRRAREDYDEAIAKMPEAKELAEATDGERQIEKKLRESAMNHYLVTGDKDVAEDVSIRIRRGVEYNHGAALAWAKRHEMFLTLDHKGFNRAILVGSIEIPFAEITDSPQVLISGKVGKE